MPWQLPLPSLTPFLLNIINCTTGTLNIMCLFVSHMPNLCISQNKINPADAIQMRYLSNYYCTNK